MKKNFLACVFVSFLTLPVLTGCFGGELDPDDPSDDDDKDVPTISIVEDEHLTLKEAGTTHWYNLKLPKDYQYTLNISLGDYVGSSYYIDYEFSVDSSYKDCVSINNKVLQTKSNAEVGDRAYLVAWLRKVGKSKTYGHESIFIDVLDTSAFITATLTSKSEDVVITDSSSTLYDFVFTVPMAGKQYQMPLVDINHVQGNYSVEFAVDDDESVELSEEREETLFKINPDSYVYNKKIYIDVKSNTQDTLRRFTCVLSVSYDDPDVFQMFYGNNRKQLKSDETMLVEKSTSIVPLDFYFNNSRINSASTVLTFEIEDNMIISKDRASTIYGYSHIFAVNKLGTTNVKVTYNKGGSLEREISFTVKVYDGKKLSGIYVPLGKDAFEIDGDNVKVNGKIYATFEVGEPEAINGYDELVITKSDTSNPNIKNVNLSYTYKGDTKQATYEVDVTSTSEYQKTTLTQNYHSYWSEAGYTATPYEGEAKILAIPVWFTDSDNFINAEKKDENNKNQKEQIIEDLETSLFGNNDEILGRSLRGFYLEESLGRLKVSGEVSPWYEDNHESTYYEDQDSKITSLTETAVNWYLSQSGKTVSDFDGDGDGKIDHVIMYYGANYHCFRNGYSVSSGWCRRIPNSYNKKFSNLTWMSTMHMYGLAGVSPKAYKQLETNDLSSIHGINSNTATHEFAHAIGIADMYDSAMKSTPTGSFNKQSNNKGSHDPYNVMAMGYTNPYVFSANDSSLSDQLDIEISDFQSSGDMILLTPNWSNSKQIFDEYLILELFTPTGLNAYDANYTSPNANCTGIRLWHVNANRSSTNHLHIYTNNSENGNYDLVHFIRNNKEETYRTLSVLEQQYLFVEGDTFTMDEYKSQFYNANGKLDNGDYLGWSFQVKTLTSDSYGNAKATITLTKSSL